MKQVFEILGSRWNLLIIWYLSEGPLRFTELQKRMGNANAKTITTHLRDLERYQLISRAVYPEVPPRVEYALTAHGKAILPVFRAIRDWGQSLPQSADK